MTERPGTVVFHRPARHHPAPVERGVVTIPAPPTAPDPAGSAVWQTVTPVLGSAGVLGFAVTTGELRHIVTAGVIAGVLVLSSTISRLVGIRTSRRDRQRATERYRAHLGEIRARLDESAAVQRRSVEAANPALHELVELVHSGPGTWERRPHHSDFLSLRLGTGTVPAWLTPELEPSDPMTLADPELLGEAATLEAETRLLSNVPIVIDLSDAGCVAVVADRSIGRRTAASLVAQLAALRSPAELTIAAHIAPEHHDEWNWIKWLPHVRASQFGSDDGTSLVSSSARELDVLLDRLTSRRLDAFEHRRTSRVEPQPLAFRQIVIVIDGYSPTSDVGRLERLDTAIAVAARIGILVVTLVDRLEHVPGDATATVVVDGSGSIAFSETQPGGIRIADISPDVFDEAACGDLARTLAPLRFRSSAAPAALDSPGLFELLGEPAGSFDPRRLWATEPTPLSTPIGLGPGGEPLVLDIREPSAGGMGPHGILIGATGSGKSELLRTLVLGLAARNPPEELSLVLADFKGGATFSGLERLPHTAGTISNIESDPTLVDRMEDALFGELERRQLILRDAGFDRADEYRQHRRSDPHAGLSPLPALLVVVDEFGELLATRPDFADLFTSIGRTGRSLGVHLLLSSQRLDEGRIRRVESHLRYRICLRTFTAEESISVIGSRASFDLPPIPGIGHIAVDSGLTQFKAGFASRRVQATDRSDSQTVSIRQFGISGPSSPVGEAVSAASSHPSSVTTEYRLAVERIEQIDRRVRPVWLAPLPESVEFIPTDGMAPLEIVIGLTDLPRRQQQLSARLDFRGTAGNLAVVGGPRSGKSTTLASIITALADGASPEDVALYGIDLGGGTLHHLEALPHVGAVFGRSHREEIPRLVRQLHGLIERRVDQFRIHRLATIDDFRRARASGTVGSPWGEVFLVIDNWALFRQDFGIDISDLVGQIASSGLHYGVHVILTAGRWQDIHLSLRDSIGGRFELRLTDPIESEIDRHAARRLPNDIAGRGIDAAGRQTQVMKPPADLGSITARWTAAEPAPPVRMLPAAITEAELARTAEGCIGIAEHDLGGWRPDLFGADPHFIVLGDGRCGKTTALRGMIRSAVRRGTVQLGIVDYRSRLRSEVPGHGCIGYATTSEEAARLTSRILAAIARRSITDCSPTPERPDIVLIVDDYDLVAGPTSNPLGPLVELLPRSSDLGFHLVVARKVAGTTRASFEPVFQRLREAGTPTLVMDGDPAEGPVAGTVKAVRRHPGRGLVVSRSRTTLVQIACFEPQSSTTVAPT